MSKTKPSHLTFNLKNTIMSSVEYLRKFVNERLTAAAEEIFGVLNKTIVKYEEEIDRQRRLMGVIRKPEIQLHRIELSQQHVCNEDEDLTEEKFCIQVRNSSLDQKDPEPSWIKEEQEELCTSQEGEQLVSKLETLSFMLTNTYKKEVPADQQVCTEERTSSLDQEDSEPPQTKVEHEELCASQEGEQLVLKEETASFMLIPIYEESDHSKNQTLNFNLSAAEKESVVNLPVISCVVSEAPNCHQLLSHNSQEAERRDEKRDKHRDSGSTRDSEPEPKRICAKSNSHSNSMNSADLSEIHSNADTDKTLFQCDTCGKAFKLKSKFDIHLRTHTDERPHSCETCRKHFRRKYELTYHMRTHTDEKPYSCKTCGKVFRRGNELRVHTRTHTGEKPYSCKTCGNAFARRHELTVHIRTHTGEKPFSCKTCGNVFARRHELTVHIRTHTGEKPFSCKTCGKGFGRSDEVTVHMRTHTGDKPYLCNTCEKRFPSPSALKKHIRTHTGEKPYLCNTCGVRFSDPSAFRRHMRTHTGEKPYSCKTCGKGFTRSIDLTVHMRTHTGQSDGCN